MNVLRVFSYLLVVSFFAFLAALFFLRDEAFSNLEASPESILGSSIDPEFAVHASLRNQSLEILELVYTPRDVSISLLLSPSSSSEEVSTMDFFEAVRRYRLEGKTDLRIPSGFLEYASAHYDARRAIADEKFERVVHNQAVNVVSFRESRDVFFQISYFSLGDRRTLYLARGVGHALGPGVFDEIRSKLFPKGSALTRQGVPNQQTIGTGLD